VPKQKFKASWLDENKIASGSNSKIVVHREFVDETRWGNIYEVIFRHDGMFWKVHYQEPATELQEGMDTWFEEDEVEATQVEPALTTALHWYAAGEEVPDHPSTRSLNAAMKALHEENASLRKDVKDLHYGMNQMLKESFGHRREMRKLKPENVQKAVTDLVQHHDEGHGDDDAKLTLRFLGKLSDFAGES
jgi:hypothetical protein